MTERPSKRPRDVLRQEIRFARGEPLGIGIDETLTIRRINNPDSPAIRNATYGVIHWTIVSVDGHKVETKAELSQAMEGTGDDLVVGLEALREEQDDSRVVSAVHGSPEDLALVMSGKKKTVAPPPVAEEVEEEVKIDEEARKVLQVGEGLPTFQLGDRRVTRLITGSCTWQLTPGDRERADVAVKGCAAYTILGCMTFDCGDIYAGVEELVGKFAATARRHSPDLAEKIRLHTKVIPDVLAPDDFTTEQLRNLLHKRITAGVFRSANRLGVPSLDLVHLHWWDWDIPGYEFAIDVLLKDLKHVKGLIKDVGLTNVDLDHLERILRGHQGSQGKPPIACVQVNFSIIDRRPMTSGLCDLCRKEKIPLLVHGVLCGGFLSSTWLGKPRPRMEDLKPGIALNLVFIDEFGGWDPFQAVLTTLNEVAESKMASIPQIALAWTLAQSGVSAVVLGARDAKHVQDAAVACSSLTLDPEDFEKIKHIVDGRGPSGPVYGLERSDPRLIPLCGSGADGDLQSPVSRQASRAGSKDHVDECARRVAALHATYAHSMPDVPPELTPIFDDLVKEPSSPRVGEGCAWMATSAYENLSTTELAVLLRNFVAELDCIDDSKAEVLPHLRTFTARMLASSEQARFIQHSSDSPRLKRSFRNTTDAAAATARAAFRDKLIAAAKKGSKRVAQNDRGQAGDEPDDACIIQ